MFFHTFMAGAHSVGVAHCSSFSNRLTTPVDPTLNSTYALTLKNICPPGSNNTVPLDPTTPDKLDNVYYQNLQANMGLLTSDENLQYDNGTQPIVAADASSEFGFELKFSQAMLAMSSINVLTGTQGQIRLNCRKFNWMSRAACGAVEERSSGVVIKLQARNNSENWTTKIQNPLQFTRSCHQALTKQYLKRSGTWSSEPSSNSKTESLIDIKNLLGSYCYSCFSRLRICFNWYYVCLNYILRKDIKFFIATLLVI